MTRRVNPGPDGLPMDDVGHVPVTDSDMKKYELARAAQAKFEVPRIFDVEDKHSYVINVLLDGTGNDGDKSKLFATNIAKLRDEIEQLPPHLSARIKHVYVAGPGTQSNPLLAALDGATGMTSRERIEYAYWELAQQVNTIRALDPDAKFAFHLEGFSRGASEIPVLTRLIHERGMPDFGSVLPAKSLTDIASYPRALLKPGYTPQTVALYDPVATGELEKLDRRLAPSVISGIQLTAADERRALFVSDNVIPPGLSEDGRFLNVVVPGVHGDVGAGYVRKGLSDRAANDMAHFRNSLYGSNIFKMVHETDDPRMLVIHKSKEGLNGAYRFTRSADRSTEGVNLRHLSSKARYGDPEIPADARDHGPQALEVRDTNWTVRRIQGEARPIATRPQVSTDVEVYDSIRISNELAPALTPGQRLVRNFSTAGSVLTFLDAKQTLDRVGILHGQSNPLAATSEGAHFIGRELGGWLGGAAAGAAVGGGTGPGVVLFVVAGGVAGSAVGDRVATWWDEREIYRQKDSKGREWHFDGKAWMRDRLLDRTQDGVDNPTKVAFAADVELARALNFKASNVAAALAMSHLPAPQDPYRLPASREDSSSAVVSDWVRNPASLQWERTVHDAFVERRASGGTSVEVALPHRAAQLDAMAEEVIANNIANSPAALAARYELIYQSSGWSQYGALPEPVQAALQEPERQVAIDGKLYARGEDGRWRNKDDVADATVTQALDATFGALGPALQAHAQQVAFIASLPPRSAEQRQLEEVTYQYGISGLNPNAEWLQAIQLATSRTRLAYGLQGNESLQLQADGSKALGLDSPVAHYQRDGQGVSRLVAITTSEDIRQALAEVRQQLPASDTSRVALESGKHATQSGDMTLSAIAEATPARDAIPTLEAITVTAPRSIEPTQPGPQLAAESTPVISATRTSVLADNPLHPDFPTYHGIHEWVREQGRWSDAEARNVSAALFQAQAADKTVKRVDALFQGVSTAGDTNLFAAYRPFGDRSPMFNVSVDANQAALRPAEQSLEEAEALRQQRLQENGVASHRVREATAVRAPVMSM